MSLQILLLLFWMREKLTSMLMREWTILSEECGRTHSIKYIFWNVPLIWLRRNTTIIIRRDHLLTTGKINKITHYSPMWPNIKIHIFIAIQEF